jgi:ribosomal protein L9
MKLYQLRDKLKEISDNYNNNFPIRKLCAIYYNKIKDANLNANAELNTEWDFTRDNNTFYYNALHKSDSWIANQTKKDEAFYHDLICTCLELKIISNHWPIWNTLTIN